MVVLDRFYQIGEKPTFKVSWKWKALHLFFFILATISGLLTPFFLDEILKNFNNHCVIHADIVFSNTTFLNVSPSTVSNSTDKKNLTDVISGRRAIDTTLSQWGDLPLCQFTQFTPLMGMIGGLIWGVFFAIITKGGAGYKSDVLSSPFEVVVPCIVFCFVYSIILLSSTIVLHIGLKDFCNEFREELNNTECTPEIDIYTFNNEKFFKNYSVVINCSYVSLFAWFGQLAILILRVLFILDFEVSLVKIMEKEEERVEQVIEFHSDEEDTTATTTV